MRAMSTLVLATLLAACTQAPSSPWQLDNDRSQLSFVSIKAGDVGEVHRFRQLRGTVDADGSAEVVIELASVDTLIPIRDERMRELLFETGVFPTATLSARVDAPGVLDSPVGGTLTTAVTAELRIRDRTTTVGADVFVARLDERTVLVTTVRPIVLSAEALGLTAGVEKLREVAGLPAISQAVPVSFTLTFVAA